MIISKRMYSKKLKELEKLTDLKFTLLYNDGEKPLILFDNEVVFYGRDCYEDLSYVVELCYKSRQKAYRDFKEPTYTIRGML